MDKKTKIIIVVFVVATIILAGALLFLNYKNNNESTGILNLPLNEIDLTTNLENLGYFLKNETYSDNPEIWLGRKPLEACFLTFSSTINNDDIIDIYLAKFNSSFSSQEELYDLIKGNWGVSSKLNQLYCEFSKGIGDESIFKVYFGNEKNLDTNKTSVILYFRIKNITGFIQKSIGNLKLDQSTFVNSLTYENYCNDIWNYAKSIEDKINSNFVFTSGQEPSIKLLKLNEIKNESTGKTVEMNVKEYIHNLSGFNVNGLWGMFSLNAVDAGDSLILKDDIMEIDYEFLYNYTEVILGDNQGLIYIYIIGNITDEFGAGDKLEVALNVEEINFSYLGEDYSIKIISETWVNLNYYVYYQCYRDSIDAILPQNLIRKV